MIPIETVLEELEQLNYEISAESRLVRVGLKEEQNLQEILSRHPSLTRLEIFQELQHRLSSLQEPDQKERLERLAFSCLELVLHAQIAGLDDQFETFLAKTSVKVSGEKIAYHDLYPRIQKESDFLKREQLGSSVQRVHQQGNSYLVEMLEKELSFLKDRLGFPDYIHYCQQKKKLEYSKLQQILWESQKRTGALYCQHMQEWLNEEIRKPLGSIQRWHASYLLRMDQFDDLFPKKGFLKRVGKAFSVLGIDLDSHKNIHLDLEDRPRKNPRACCYGSKIPQEIHLIMKPVGGQGDYETFLHEAGHALHHANTNPNLSYEYRHLSRSNALSETYAFLLQNLTMNVEWLVRLMEIDRVTAQKIRYYRILVDLYMFRRYIAKLTAELRFFQQSDLKTSRFYADTLTGLTQFIYDPSSYLFDMDSEFYSADYLRAWIAEAQLERYLVEKFDWTWWRHPKVKDLLMSFWQTGERNEAEELLQQLGLQPFELAPLEIRFQELEQLKR